MKNMNKEQHAMKMNSKNSTSMYMKLSIMIVIMFIVMYFIMFSMIDKIGNLIPNINNLYMALLMTTSMVIIELLIMREMYPSKKWNVSILIVSLAIMIFSFFGIRDQIEVGNKEFVKGMIPHHSAALLMSSKAKLTDPDLIKLKDSIMSTQQREIDLMKSKLKELQ